MKGHMQDGKFHPHTDHKKGVRKSRDQKAKLQGVRMKRHNVCQPFLEDPASHKPDDNKHTNQIMYSLGDESCASVLTDEEFSMLLTDNQVANTFSPIGETATKWQQDDAFRKRIIDRAQELIEEQKKGERKARGQTHEDFVKEHFNTGIKLSKGWKFSTFPPIGKEKTGSEMNSRSQIQVEKGNDPYKKGSIIRMNQWDGRLGGGYRITVEHRSPKGFDGFDFHLKKYDEAIDKMQSLMRMIK